ncbi:MAG TPA: DUF1330 domain-containing protein [Spirochaetes bacterium]|nr:DUF1330 domain-containing protein [Spirochaetota bacterium]
MSAYLVALLKINDRKEFDKYRAGVHDTIDKHKGEIIVSNENAEVIEGEWPYTKTVVIRFPSMEAAKRWYESPEYQEVVKHRFRAAETNLIFIEGRL